MSLKVFVSGSSLGLSIATFTSLKSLSPVSIPPDFHLTVT